MKTPTNIDVVDSSWTWTAGYHLYWRNDRLVYDLPDNLTDEQLWAWDDGARAYQPLRQHTALFIEFSDTPPTKAGILNFAKSYGSLENASMEEPTRQQWVEAITSMRDAVALWRAV